MSKLFSSKANVSSKSRITADAINRDRSFILTEKTPFSIKEEYKTLRTNVMFSIPGDGCKIVGISSSEAMEGKSLNCLNLAIAFAQTNAKVLLIDCDMRLPKQASLIAKCSAPGLSNVLVGMSKIEEAIRKTDYYKLHVLLSGDIPPNPSELLGSPKMDKLINELSIYYDYIFIDLPPINVVADASIVSQYLSGIILIVRSANASRETVKKALSQLELANANVIGIVLNGVETKNIGGYEKYGKYAKRSKYDNRYASRSTNNPNTEAQGKDKKERLKTVNAIK